MDGLLREFMRLVCEVSIADRESVFNTLDSLGKPLARTYVRQIRALGNEDLQELLVHLDYVEEHAGGSAGDPNNPVWTSGPVYPTLGYKAKGVIDMVALLEPGYIVELDAAETETLWRSYISNGDVLDTTFEQALDVQLYHTKEDNPFELVIPLMLGDVSDDVIEMVEETYEQIDDDDDPWEWTSPVPPMALWHAFADSYNAAISGGKKR